MEVIQKSFEDHFSSSEEIEQNYRPEYQDLHFSSSVEEQKDPNYQSGQAEDPNRQSNHIYEQNQQPDSREEHREASGEHMNPNNSQNNQSSNQEISYIYPKNPQQIPINKQPEYSGNQDNPQESIDFKHYSGSILYKGDNEDSAWLGDGMSTLGGLILQDEAGKPKTVETHPKDNPFMKASQPAQNRRTMISRKNTEPSKVYDLEASHDGLSIGDETSQSPSLSSSRSYTVYTESDVSQMMLSEDVYRVIQERKKAALMRLKEWEEARIKIMNEHRGLCEHLFQVMKNKITVLKDGLQGMFAFFFERAKQEDNFAKSVMRSIPKLEGLFEEQRSKKEQRSFNKILQESDFYHHKCIERGSILAKFIERNIIQDILIQEEKRFNDAVNPLLEDFRKLRVLLNRENDKAMKVGKSYLEIYRKSLNYVKLKDDLYALEMKFVKQAQVQLIAQRKLGDFTAGFVGDVKKHEILRYENCSKALKAYLMKMNELYHFGKDPVVLELLEKFESQNESDDRFQLDMILKQDHLTMLSKTVPEGQVLTSGEVIQYLKGLQYPELSVSPLIFCDSKAPLEKNSQLVGTLNSHIAVTVDANVLVYDLDPVTKDYKIHREMKFKSISLKDRSDDSNIVEFTEARARFIGKVTRHVRITFNNTEEKLQFLKTLEFLGEKDFRY